MKISLLKFRYVLLGLLTVHWILFLIYQVYIYREFKFLRVDFLVVPFAVLSTIPIAFKKKWTDIFSFVFFAFYFIWLIKGFAYYCQDQNLDTIKICVNTIALKLPEVWSWFEFTWLMLSIVTIIFLPLSIFNKKDTKFE